MEVSGSSPPEGGGALHVLSLFCLKFQLAVMDRQLRPTSPRSVPFKEAYLEQKKQSKRQKKGAEEEPEIMELE